MSLILALESDPDRGRTLKRLAGEWMDAEVVVAPSTEHAIEFMRQHAPDLILVSALTTAADDRSLTEFLNQTAEARQVPTLTVPPMIEPDDRTLREQRGGLLSFFGLGRKRRLHLYDPQALSTRLREALEGSCSDARVWSRTRRDAVPIVVQEPVATYDLDLEALLQDFSRSHGAPAENAGTMEHGEAGARARARRWNGGDLPWLTEVKLPWGLRVDLLNISSSGLLVKSPACFVEGSPTVFRLSGVDRDLLIPARVIRSEVTTGQSQGGVTYQAAVSFDSALLEADLLRPVAPAPSPEAASEPLVDARALSFTREVEAAVA